MRVGGGVEHAVEADVQEVELVEDLPLKMLVLVAAHSFQVAGQVAGVAAERRGAEAILRGQLAVGDPGPQLVVDELPVGMVADGTAFRHELKPRRRLRHRAACGRR